MAALRPQLRLELVSNAIDDPELKAMGLVLEALSPLDGPAKHRVLHWVATKLEVAGVPTVGAPAISMALAASEAPRREGTVSMVAIKLGADSCRTLMIAAAVHLSLYQGHDSFTRAEWIACAKDARPWKANYNSQIPTIISRLLDSGLIFEKAKDVYSVDEAFLREQEAKIAGG